MTNEALTIDDVADLMKAVAWISSAEVAFFARRYPKAVRWTEIWAELRQSYGPIFDDDAKHRSAVVLCWRNKRSKKTRERVLFVGSGDCPVCTATDLLLQLRSEIPEAFGNPFHQRPNMTEPAPPPGTPVSVRIQGPAYPIGLFGGLTRGIG